MVMPGSEAFAADQSPMKDMRLSEVLGGLGQSGQMLHLASKLVKNKDSKTLLNLMSMATGAAATTKDPMALMQTMQGPMSDITTLTQEEQKKRMSEVMPPVGAQPATQPSGAPNMMPMIKKGWLRSPKNFPDRGAVTPTEEEIFRRLGRGVEY